MAWEWSHTAEAYENVKLNIDDLDIDTLATVVAEIAGKKHEDSLEENNQCFFKSGMYDAEFEKAKKLPEGILAEKVWAFAEEYRTCTNGGFEAYICPYGCHTVSFDRDEG